MLENFSVLFLFDYLFVFLGHSKRKLRWCKDLRRKCYQAETSSKLL